MSIFLNSLAIALAITTIKGFNFLFEKEKTRLESNIFVIPSVIILVSYFMGYFNDPMPRILFCRVSAIIILAGFFYSIYKKQFQIKKNLSLIIFITFISIYPIFPALLEIRKLGGNFGLASLGNNDLGVYAIQVEQFRRHNLFGGPYLENGNLSLTRVGYFGFTALSQYIQNISHLSSWQSTYLCLIFSEACLAIALYSFTRTMFPKIPRSISYLIVMIAILNPLQSYLMDHGFGGQILGMAGVVIILESTLNVISKNTPSVLTLFSGFVISSFTYQPFVLIALPFTIFTGLKILRSNQKKVGKILSNENLKLLGLGITIIGSVGILRSDLQAALFLSKTKAGWPLHLGTLSARVTGFVGLGVFLTIIFLIYILGIISFLIKSRNRTFKVSKKFKDETSIIFLISVLVVVFFPVYATILRIQYGSWSEYHTWKGVSYFLPLLIISGASSFYIAQKRLFNFKPLMFLILACLFTTFELWNNALIPTYLIVQPDLEILSHNKILEHLRVVNVNLAPYLESAVAASGIPTKLVVLNQPTTLMLDYPGKEVTRDPSTCTLTRVQYIHGEVPKNSIYINQSLVLIPFPSPCRTL